MSRTRLQRGVLVSLLVFCSGCVFSPRNISPADDITPSQFTGASGAIDLPDQWWTSFDAKDLNSLVMLGLRSNLSIAQAAARLEQAGANAIKSGAARVPSVSLEARGSVKEVEEASSEDADTTSESAEAGLAASYELDLWGRVRSGAKGSARERDAAGFDLQAARISVAAEITIRYLELMRVREKTALVTKQKETDKTISDLLEFRFRRSQATALDVLQQREQTARTKALLPPLRSKEATLLNQLAVLTGQLPRTDLNLKTKLLPKLPRLPRTGLPAELLSRRPDIRAAAERFEAARWKEATAKAARLPAISISASAGYSSADLSNIFDSWTTRLAANLVGPVIDGGNRKAESARARAVATERLAGYRQAVLNAFREVEDALVVEKNQTAYVEALRDQRNAADAAQKEAIFRYQNGDAQYLPVLVSLRGVQAIDRSIVDARFDHMAYRVNLYRALAGGWKDDDSEIKGKDTQ